MSDQRKDDGPKDPAQQLVNLMKAAQQMWLEAARASAAEFPRRPSDAAQAGQPEAATPGQPDPLVDLVAASQQFIELQQSYFNQMSSAWLNLLGVVSAPATPATDPRFEALTRTYLAYSSGLQSLVEGAPLDEKNKGQLRYAVRQYAEAMSPSNFLATNPEALQLAAETGGRSLTEGLSLFFHDLAQGRVSMTDEEAFAVGRNVAVSAGAVVYENDLIQLIQYAPRTEQVHERPLLIVPPCINKYYILDLQPENSLVRHAVERGHTVFLVSWRNITPDTGHFTWDDYVRRGVIQALEVALQIAGADRANTLGFCVGGTLLASALGVEAARGEHKAASMTLLTTMLDFSDGGEIGHLVSERTVGARESAIGAGGVMSGRELGFVFSSLRANDLIWQYVVNSYLKGRKPPAFDLLYWNSDAANLPGPMFCWYVRNTYLENRLSTAGGTIQCGQPVDLSAIGIPAYLYASREDHIVPWQSAYASTRILGGDTTFVLGASGHIAGVINPPARKKRNYWVGGAAGADPESWLAAARSEPGSWWPHWSAWLAKHAGAHRPARQDLGNPTYLPIEPAPGRYVRARAD